MTEPKRCPFMREPCKQEGCMFWVKTSGSNKKPETFNCCVPRIAEVLSGIEYQMISRRP
jgi:hypothetical protein